MDPRKQQKEQSNVSFGDTSKVKKVEGSIDSPGCSVWGRN